MKRILIIGSMALVLGLLIVSYAIPALAHSSNNGGADAASGVSLDRPTVTRLAQALNLTPDELISHLQDGETLSAIAGEQNVSEEAVVAAIVAPYSGVLELRVRYGYITQQQSDLLLKEAEGRARSLLEQDLSAAGRYGGMEEYCAGMMNGSGGMMGGWGGMMSGWNGMMNGSDGMMNGNRGGMTNGDGGRSSRAYNGGGNGGWGNTMGRFWDNLTSWNWGGMAGGGMGGGGMMGGR